MNTKKITTTAEIKKIVRSGGKDFAVVTIHMPAKIVGDLPLGEVNMTVNTLQPELGFGGPSKKAYKE